MFWLLIRFMGSYGNHTVSSNQEIGFLTHQMYKLKNTFQVPVNKCAVLTHKCAVLAITAQDS